MSLRAAKGNLATTTPSSQPACASRSHVTRRAAITGSGWDIVSYGGTQILTLGSNMVMSRLLFPEAFGLLALIYALLGGLKMFSDIGIGPSIIQSPGEKDSRFFGTAWSLQAFRGLCIWVATIALAGPAASIYSQPALVWALPVVGLTALIQGLNSVALFTLSRDLRLRSLTIIELSAQLIGILSMVVWAMINRSVWALVGGSIIHSTFKLALSHVMLPALCRRFAWDAEAARRIVRFGKWILLSTLISFLANQIDKVILAKLIPIGELGIYSVAMAVAVLPSKLLSRLAQNVLFPFWADSARTGLGAMESRFRRTRQCLLPVAFALAIGSMLAAPAFFTLFYDARYHQAGWIAQWASIALWFTLLQAIDQGSLLALGDSRSLPCCNILNLLVTIPGCLIGYRLMGMKGFLFGLGAGNMVGLCAVHGFLLSHSIQLVIGDALYTAMFLSVACLGTKAADVISIMLNIPTAMGHILLLAILAPFLISGILYAKRLAFS